MRTLKIAAITILVLLSLVGGLIGLVWLSIESDRKEEAALREEVRVDMQSYLVKKYDKQFVVKDPVRKASGIGVEGYLESEFHPVDEKTEFYVSKSGDRFSDDYLVKTWEQQAKPEVGVVVDRIFNSDDVWYKADINLPDEIEYDYAKDLDFYKAYPEVKSRGLLYGVHVRLESSKFNESEYQETLYQLSKYVQGKDVDKPSLRYIIDVKGDYSMYVCSLYDDKLDAISSIEDLKGCFKSYNGLEGDDIE